MAKIDNITLGTVRVYNKSFSRSLRSLYTGDGFTYPQDVNWTERGWNIRGTLNAQTQAVIDSIENLNNHSNPVILDLNDKYTGFIQWVMVERMTATPIGSTLYRYDLNVRKIPCIGTIYMQTKDVYLHSLDYRANYKMVDPMVGRFNKLWSVNRLEQTWEFYVDNDKNAIQTAILEFWASEAVDSLELWYWRLNGVHDWRLVHDWGGVHAWDSSVGWADDDAIDHFYRANVGVRGEVLAGIGTISNKLGNYNRILLSITALQANADPANDVSTDHASYQLLLKAKITSTSRETLRPYPVVKYITGGVGPTPA